MSASEKNAFVTKPAMSSRTSSFQRAKHVWITPSSGSEMWRGHGALLRRISATLLTELSGRIQCWNLLLCCLNACQLIFFGGAPQVEVYIKRYAAYNYTSYMFDSVMFWLFWNAVISLIVHWHPYRWRESSGKKERKGVEADAQAYLLHPI